MSSEDGEEEFLSLEDEDGGLPKPKPRRSKKKPTQPAPKVVEKITTEVVDMQVLGDYGGNHYVNWPIQDMDCPDCASKAAKAIGRLNHVSEIKVSATDASVAIKVNLDKGAISEVSSILRSLGHAPDIIHQELKGVKAEEIAQRHNISTKGLPRLFRRQPGILDCEIDKEGRILLQIAPDLKPEFRKALDDALKGVIGSTFQLSESKSRRITPGQWRLIGSGFAFIFLILIIGLKLLKIDNPYLIGGLGGLGVLIGGAKMFSHALANLKNRQMGFRVLTSLAVLGASYLQHWDEALMVVILVSWTEHMEAEALIKARKAMQGGLDRLPRTARRITKQIFGTMSVISKGSLSPVMAKEADEFEEVPVDLLMKGDTIEVRSGELIPADGFILSGNGSVNKAPLTGESVPLDVTKGDQLQAGLTLVRGPVKMSVVAVGEDTRLSGLIQAVHTYREQPTRLQGMLENFTSVWVPFVLIGAVIAGFSQPENGLNTVLLLWVVACPCALLLAAPVPHAAGLSKASKSGAIVRGGDVLEALAKVNLALLDKTGTLTSGKPRVGEIVLGRGYKRGAALELAAGLEVSSNHPYARAIIALAKDEGLTPAKVSGLNDGVSGVHGKLSGKVVEMVRATEDGLSQKLTKALTEAFSLGHGASLLRKEGKEVALITFIHDDLRPGAAELVKDLHSQGITVEMLSGDNQDAVNTLAREIGLPELAAHGEMNPEDKVEWVNSRSNTHITMMVGDGFNDAAAMAKADIGVAIGAGESVNLEAADVLIPGDDPRLLSELIEISKKTSKILKWNISYSVLVTMILVYAVLSGLNESLTIAVLVHELSVIGVIVNGARLSGAGETWKLISDIGKSVFTGTIDSFKVLFSKA